MMVPLQNQSISLIRSGNVVFFETDITDMELLKRIFRLVVVSFDYMNIPEHEEWVIDGIEVAADVAAGPSRTRPDDMEAT